ncbi:GNAT family N-acetyltransferase [Acinetobacter lwoffii]|uniref:GNAT family N-acetyltransferase n=1 Tax=Acinetobacter lwoffii TaxID=28090 RepID=UPI002DBF062D|nr:GNAT family N-acetyltransferase [Acinetobacter lwoffii]MEB6680158.1 GNAT family N-acetyltransferase [Acinetobacter lwoffii]
MQFKSLKAKTIHFKLVEENDAEFICSLRTNPDLNKHLSQSTALVEEQKLWIKNYKNRESKRLEYYFIIYRNDNNEKIGTIRVYDFKEDPRSFCWGSWILNANKTRYAAIESAMLVYKFAFEELGFEQSHFDVRKENVGVHKFHLRLGAMHIDGNELDNFYIYPAARYFDILSEYQDFLG